MQEANGLYYLNFSSKSPIKSTTQYSFNVVILSQADDSLVSKNYISNKKMKLSEEQIERIKEYLRTTPVTRAFIFGSYVKDHANEQSDVDILVELDYSNPIGLLFIKIALDLEEILHKKVDLVTSNGISKYILPYVQKERVLIYERV
jgi:predicted nucleotidyltransferase